MRRILWIFQTRCIYHDYKFTSQNEYCFMKRYFLSSSAIIDWIIRWIPWIFQTRCIYHDYKFTVQNEYCFMKRLFLPSSAIIDWIIRWIPWIFQTRCIYHDYKFTGQNWTLLHVEIIYLWIHGASNDHFLFLHFILLNPGDLHGAIEDLFLVFYKVSTIELCLQLRQGNLMMDHTPNLIG